MPSNRAGQSGESVPTDHESDLRNEDAPARQYEIGTGQSGAESAESERGRRQTNGDEGRRARGSERQKYSRKEVETLLKYGAYDLFKEEHEGRSEELSTAFCEADIDQILEKNTKVITIDSQGGSSYSKASFITDTSDEIDIDDPNFWTKIVGLKEPSDELGPRTPVKKYPTSQSDEPDLVVLTDEIDWTKIDRDTLMRLVGIGRGDKRQLLTYGWGQWKQIYADERMQKHPLGSVQIVALCLIGQTARAKMFMENDAMRKNGPNSGGVRVSQQAREALEYLRDSYDICGAVLESVRQAEAGDTESVAFPHSFPLLVRDMNWWQREIKVYDKHLKHMSFLYQLHTSCRAFRVELGGELRLPSPQRAALPAAWWTMQEDHDCLIGIERHGWNNWRDICLDPDLCFAKQGVQWNGPAVTESIVEEGETSPTTPTPSVPSTSTIAATTAAAAASTPATSTPTVPEGDAKIFPASHMVIKRMHRLVNAMQRLVKKGAGDLSLSSLKNGQNGVGITSEWDEAELRSLRNAIKRWGIPVPPVLPARELRRGKPVPPTSRRDRTIFSLENIPLTPEQEDLERRLSVAASVLSGVVQKVYMKVGDAVKLKSVEFTESAESTDSKSDAQRDLEESEALLLDGAQNEAWLGLYPANCYDVQRSLGLFGNRLGPFEFLRVQAKLKSKTTDQVREMVRQMEKRSIERFQASREAHPDGEEGKKEKEKEDKNDIIPSNTVGQRIYRRLQLYYEIQQYVWDKDEPTMRAILTRWERDGSRRQDHLSEGWNVQIHDMALLKGLRKWGIEWDLVWSDPEMPFTKPVSEKKNASEATGNAEAAANETAMLSMKTVDRSIIVRLACCSIPL